MKLSLAPVARLLSSAGVVAAAGAGARVCVCVCVCVYTLCVCVCVHLVPCSPSSTLRLSTGQACCRPCSPCLLLLACSIGSCARLGGRAGKGSGGLGGKAVVGSDRPVLSCPVLSCQDGNTTPHSVLRMDSPVLSCCRVSDLQAVVGGGGGGQMTRASEVPALQCAASYSKAAPPVAP